VRSKPTGRRTLTLAKLAALDYPAPAPGGPSRGEVLAAFRRAAPALGLFPIVPLLNLLMTRSFAQDWTGTGRPMVWVSNHWLCVRLGVGEGRLKELIRLAFELGLIAMRDAGSGRRQGEREGGEGGCILWAYGFDLSPLAARHAEFRERAAAFEEREALLRRLRLEVSRLRRDILTLADVGLATLPEATDWADLAIRTRQLRGQSRTQDDPDVVQLLISQLQAMHGEVRALFEPAETSESDPSGSSKPPRSTHANQSINANADAQARKQVVPKRSATLGKQSQDDAEPADPLNGFPASPAFVLMIAPPFQSFTVTSRPTRNEVVSAAWHVCRHLEISQDAWGEACLTFGRWEAAVAVAAITGRHLQGKVDCPGGLLRHLIKLYNTGELRLDRTLRGLAARLAEAGKVPAPVLDTPTAASPFPG
jgi:replication initiation protein RepC